MAESNPDTECYPTRGRKIPRRNGPSLIATARIGESPAGQPAGLSPLEGISLNP